MRGEDDVILVYIIIYIVILLCNVVALNVSLYREKVLESQCFMFGFCWLDLPCEVQFFNVWLRRRAPEIKGCLTNQNARYE